MFMMVEWRSVLLYLIVLIYFDVGISLTEKLLLKKY